MAVDLRCPNCMDNLGKDVENPRNAFCGNCGQRFVNKRGYTDEDEEKYENGRLGVSESIRNDALKLDILKESRNSLECR